VSRAGAVALSLLSAPLNVHLLEALGPGALPLIDLRRSVGSPPQSTMRVYSRAMVDLGTLERQRQPAFPGTVEYASTDSGKALLEIGEIHAQWLSEAPAGPVALGSTASKSTTKALVEGWSTNIIRALSAKPLSLTDLNRLIPRISYPSLERRLGALRLADLVEAHQGDGRGTPYRATPWLRKAIVPLAAGAWWERRYLVDPPLIGRLDVEAVFLLAIPMVDLPVGLSGRCRLSVEIQGGSSPVFAGVLINVEDGKVVSCSSRLEGEAEAWASGSAGTWMRRMSGQDGDLEFGGDSELVREIVDAIRKSSLGQGLAPKP
jgi:DNA-binding HxlR family transcriptional regulator